VSKSEKVCLNMNKVNALVCFMLYALCFMLYALCFMQKAKVWKVSESSGRPRKAAEGRGSFDIFRRYKTTFFYLCFCFVCYAVQSLSPRYKTLSPFLGGGV